MNTFTSDWNRSTVSLRAIERLGFSSRDVLLWVRMNVPHPSEHLFTGRIPKTVASLAARQGRAMTHISSRVLEALGEPVVPWAMFEHRILSEDEIRDGVVRIRDLTAFLVLAETDAYKLLQMLVENQTKARHNQYASLPKLAQRNLVKAQVLRALEWGIK